MGYFGILFVSTRVLQIPKVEVPFIEFVRHSFTNKNPNNKKMKEKSCTLCIVHFHRRVQT